MTTKKFTNEKLNYFRLCSVITDDVRKGLRTVFKRQWNARYQATYGQWLDVPANAIDFKNMESPGNKRRNKKLLKIMANGNTNEWDCTCLFYAILYSDCLGKSLNPTVKTNVDKLREIRNELFAHPADGRLADVEFDDAMPKILAAFKGLGLDTVEVEAIKNQKSFPTDELSRIQQLLNDEKKRYAKFNSFCVLPPKPSHDTTDRADEVKTINHEMEKLRCTKKNETTVIYLSGNPGCGKSEIARQIGNEYFDKVPEEEGLLKFVFTFNASSITTLLQSYVDFAARLSCDEDSVTRITTSENLSQEEKIEQIKSFVNPKVQIYSSWLIIVDNVNDLGAVSKYLPQAGEKTSRDGQIVVTTQDSQAIPRDSYTYHYPSLKKGMKEDDAITLLTQISGITGDRDTLLNIASTLDFQPLALACAAVYMQQVFHYTDQSEAKWEKYLLKLQKGKREATEEAFKKTTKTYESTMTAAVKLALERVTDKDKDKIMMHAFQFLSVIANEPVPLKYVVRHVMNCMPGKDQVLVAAHINSSSLVISSEDGEMSKVVRVHQVVYHGLQKLFKNDGFDVMKLMSVFSDLPSFKNVYDVTKEEMIATRSLMPHFVAISDKLKDFLGRSHLTGESLTADCLFKAGWICSMQGSYKASEIFLELCLSIRHRALDCVPGGPSLDSSYFEMNKLHEDKQSNYLETTASSVNASVALATTLKTLGVLYRQLMDCKKAQIHLEAALAIEERLYEGDDPELAITLMKLGYCLFYLKQHGKAEAYLQRALAIQEKESVTKNDHLLADILIGLIRVLQSQGESEKAKSYHQRALKLEEKFHDIESPQLSNTIHNLGLCSSNFKNEQQAITFYKKSLEMDESMYHANHPYKAITLINLGRSLLRLGERERAKGYYEEALAVYENGNNQDDSQLADVLDYLGCCFLDDGQYDKAQAYLERSVAIHDKGDNENSLAVPLCALAYCVLENGQYDKAQAYLLIQRALSIHEKKEDGNDPILVFPLYSLGLCLKKKGHYEKAIEYLERGVTIIFERGNDKRNPHLSRTLNCLDFCLKKLGQHEKAQVYWEKALSIQEKGNDVNDSELANTLNNLGFCLIEQKQLEKAQEYLERAMSIREKTGDENELSDTLHNLGCCFLEQRQYEKALVHFEKELTIRETYIGSCLIELKEHDKAQAYLERTLSIREKKEDGNDPILPHTLYLLGLCLKEQGHYEKAIEYLERGVTIIFERVDDEHDPHLPKTLNCLDFCLKKLGQHEKAQVYWEKARSIREEEEEERGTAS